MKTDAPYTTQIPDKIREITIDLLTVQEQRIRELQEVPRRPAEPTSPASCAA